MKHFTKEYWTNRDVNIYIGKLLRYGVILSCAVTLFGGIVYLIQHKGNLPDYKAIPSGIPFDGTADYLRELTGIFSAILQFDGAAIIQLGVIILIATPVLRVAFSVLAFFVEKDYLYVGITILVLAIIMANMALGIH